MTTPKTVPCLWCHQPAKTGGMEHPLCDECKRAFRAALAPRKAAQ